MTLTKVRTKRKIVAATDGVAITRISAALWVEVRRYAMAHSTIDDPLTGREILDRAVREWLDANAGPEYRLHQEAAAS